jgi:hypothetical protein
LPTMTSSGDEESAGQARFGCLTLTLSLSRFAPDLEPTMTCGQPQNLKRSGKPKLTRGHGLRFQIVTDNRLKKFLSMPY